LVREAIAESDAGVGTQRRAMSRIRRFSYEAIRLWCRKFGLLLANDEVALTIHKHRYWLWRAVDQDGTVLETLPS
jgi:transposase-like protein